MPSGQAIARSLHRAGLTAAAAAVTLGLVMVLAFGIVWLRDPWSRKEAPHRPQGVRAAVVETPALGGGDTFVVLYTGDNGWQKSDRGFAAALAARGYPTVAIDSLRYFSRAPGRRGAAKDLARVIEAYSRTWNRPRVIVAGYSFGGSALAQIIPDLPPATRSRIRGVALVAPNPSSDLLLAPYSLFDLDLPGTPSTRALLPRLAGYRVTCIYAIQDAGDACAGAQGAQGRAVPGGHRFKGEFDQVAAFIAETGAGTNRRKKA